MRGRAPLSVLSSSTMALLIVGCASTPGAPSRGASVEIRSPAAEEAAVILSVHVTQRGEAGEGEDELLVVFSHHIDASSLDPAAFMVIRGDGRGVQPRRAVLGPADEDDENRSVTLIGRFSDEALGVPVAVHVIGELFTESGADLRSRDGIVRGPEVPDELVYAESIVPGPGACDGAAQLIRTYWSDVLDGVEVGDEARIHLFLVDGAEVVPSRFDDHAIVDPRQTDGARPSGSADAVETDVATVPRGLTRARDDNVLDMCVNAEAAVSAVAVDSSTFRDRGGRATATTRVTVSGS